MAYNHIALMGYITHDIRLSKTSGGKDYICFQIAVRRVSSFKTYQKEDFFTIYAYGALARFIDRYFWCGKAILVSGELHAERMRADDGTPIVRHSVVATYVSFASADRDQLSSDEYKIQPGAGYKDFEKQIANRNAAKSPDQQEQKQQHEPDKQPADVLPGPDIYEALDAKFEFPNDDLPF